MERCQAGRESEGYMERNEKESLNVNNFGHYMLDFISDRVKISGQSNSDKWSLLFQKIEEWKKQ